MLVIALLLCILAAASTVFTDRTFAQDSSETVAPGLDRSSFALGGTDITDALTWVPGTNENLPASGASNLSPEPTSGAAPLMADFYAILANPQASSLYQWDLGDGAESSMPPGAYLTHVYQRPGTYICSLTLTNAQGVSSIVSTTIIVLAH
jgi:PKD repeat protein